MDLNSELIKIRRTIHQYPELGCKEYRTSEFIRKVLDRYNICNKSVNKTGVVGILKGKLGHNNETEQHCIALRADIDALPVDEQNNKPYKSKYRNIMHACGHDANTTIVLGAAILLSRISEQFNGTVKFIFQPNEESADGAQGMIKSGVLKKPDVTAIVGIHVNSQLSTGIVGIKYGEMMSAVDKFEVDVFGGGGHAAYPHQGKDTILCVTEIINSIHTIVSRKIDPVEPVVISITTINGGTRFNILAEKVNFTGTVRTLNERMHKFIPKIMFRTINDITKRHNLKFNFKYDILGYPLINVRSILDICVSAAKKVSKIKILDKPSMGGEDFAEYLRYVPGCFIYIGSRKDNNTGYPWHHPKFDIDETVLLKGAEVLKEIVLEYLKFN